jgi:hypothetical protein
MNMGKVLLAFVIAIGAIFWAFNSTRSQSYSGENLNFEVGGGTVSVTNSADQPIAVQLVGAGSRSFRVSTTIDGVSGSSERQTGDSGVSHLFEFELPPGTSEFTIANGSDVSFVAESDSNLQATVHPQTSGSRQTTMIIALVVILGAFYYASNATGHQWINMLRGKVPVAADTTPTPVVVTDGGQGPAATSYGDNRGRTGD